MPRSCSDQCTSVDESNARAAGDISPSHSADSVDGSYCPYAYLPKTYYSYSDEDSVYKYLMEGSPSAKPKDSDEEDSDKEDATEDEYPFLSSGDVVFKKCALDLPIIGKNKKKREEEEEEEEEEEDAGSAKNKKQKKTKAGRGDKKNKAKKKARPEAGRAKKKMF